MSVLLNEILADLRAQRIDYEEFLKRIGELARQVQSGKAEDTPERLDTRGKRAIFNWLMQRHGVPSGAVHETTPQYGPEVARRTLALALQIDETVRRVRPHAFRGNRARENIIKDALLPMLGNSEEVELIFTIITAQAEY